MSPNWALVSRFMVTSVTAVVLPNIETLNSQPMALLSFVTFRFPGSLTGSYFSQYQRGARGTTNFHRAAQVDYGGVCPTV